MDSGSNQLDDLDVAEKDPTRRYVRSDEIVEETRVFETWVLKTVYKAFDEESGLEVAWIKVDISNGVLESGQTLDQLHSETHQLESLKHRNVRRCYHSWVDNTNKSFNMITEHLTSGNLQQYCRKLNYLEIKVIKRWAKQILQGLHYLHSQNPPIVHKHLNCENIFVNGNSGTVKIGDLGLAAVLQKSLGDSEDEECNAMDDIYSFGICMLQMVKVCDAELRKFIDKCLAPKSERLSAIDLLNDPYLGSNDLSPVSCCIHPLAEPQIISEVVKERVTETNKFKLRGELKDRESIAMTLWIVDLKGKGKKINFVFLLQTDTVVSVTEEMMNDLNLSTEDAALMAHVMKELIEQLVPGFECHTPTKEKGERELFSPEISRVHPSNKEQNKESDIEVTDVNKSADDHTKIEFQTASKGESEGKVEHELFPTEISRVSLSDKEQIKEEEHGSNNEQNKEEDHHGNRNVDGNRNSNRKLRKAVSSCLKKLLVNCGRQL